MQGAGRRSPTNFNGHRIAIASHQVASLCPEIGLVYCGQTLFRRALGAEKHPFAFVDVLPRLLAVVWVVVVHPLFRVRHVPGGPEAEAAPHRWRHAATSSAWAFPHV
jgi:hypothetical protein